MKKVAIVGSQEQTRDNAPYDDKSYEIWSFADWICYDWLKRCDVLFEVHQPSYYMNHKRTPSYWNKLKTLKIPVYMYPVPDPRVPNSVTYPLDEILEMISGGTNMGKAFKPFSYSGAYAMALAIYMGYEVIDIYGTELAHPGEYMSQQPNFAFWIGFALGKGIKININCSEGLFYQKLYGFEDNTEQGKLFAYKEAITKQLTEANKTQAMAEGALQVLDNLINSKGK